MAYRVIESELKDEWDVELIECEYEGCIFHINSINFEESEDKQSAILHFDYDILNDYVPNDQKEFEQYLGDTIMCLIQDSMNHAEAKRQLSDK